MPWIDSKLSLAFTLAVTLAPPAEYNFDVFLFCMQQTHQPFQRKSSY